MREQVIELLKFPRRWIAHQMELEACPYNGNYNCSERICERCELSPECRWVFNNSEFIDLRQKSLTALLESLDLALWLVDARRPYGSHVCQCSCDLCVWRRQAEELLTANSFPKK